MITKNEVQQKAVQAIIDNNYNGLILAATGVGKSKIALDVIKKMRSTNDRLKTLIVVPTENLRDNNWKFEFIKWNLKDYYETDDLTMKCYASINNMYFEHFDLVILDEAHRITEVNINFFKQNNYDHVIGLTATYPEDTVKQSLLKFLKLKTVFSISLDEAVDLELVAPYNITVVTCDLNDTDKYIESGNKNNRFMVTELADYNYITKLIKLLEKKIYGDKDVVGYGYQAAGEEIDKQKLDRFRLNRMQKLYKYMTKGDVAEYLLKYVIPQNERTLIFSSNIEQSNRLCAHNFHNKTNDEDYWLFHKEEINRLSCVGKLNEGENIPNVDNALITQVNKNSLIITQKIGRIIRHRPNHIGNIWILVYRNTVDEQWLQNAIKDFDENNIRTMRFNDLRIETERRLYRQ